MLSCPHCGHQQESGKFCDDCGLVIPQYKKKADVVVGHLVSKDDLEKHKCSECGYQFVGDKCPNCGVPRMTRNV